MPRVSPDSTTYTFTLRGDLKWSDGSPINVDDFLFAFDQATREENHYVQLDVLQDIASFRAPDRQTIEVMLKGAWPHDLALAIANSVSPVPKRVWSGRVWTDPSSNPEILHPSIVLGPFTPEAGSVASFAALGTYYGGRPLPPRVEIVPFKSASAAYEALRTNKVNWLHSLPADLYQEARATPGVQLVEWTPANAAYRSLEFNVTRPFLSDKRVRQALALAVSRADLINLAENGLAEPQFTFIQPTNQRWVNASGVERYEYDMTRARQLLRDAGYPTNGQPTTLQVVYPTSSGAHGKIAAYLELQYGQLGIQVDARGLDFNAFTDQVQTRRDFDIALATYGGGSLDPDLAPRAQLITNGPQNVTGYANPEVDELFREGAQEMDPTRRKQLYDQLQALINADVPSHYLYALKSVDAFSVRVHGVVPKRSDRLDANDALLAWRVDR